MKIGYPCINNSILRTVPTTFRLASYSENKLVQTVSGNLSYLEQILEYNVKHGLLYFRISSDLIPFASHPICKLNWYERFQSEFEEIGSFVRKHNIRISMHPDQFVILNSPNTTIIKSSISELTYHCSILDAMKLDETAKVQIHVGGIYGNKIEALKRFVTVYNTLNDAIRRRLVIENEWLCITWLTKLFSKSIVSLPRSGLCYSLTSNPFYTICLYCYYKRGGSHVVAVVWKRSPSKCSCSKCIKA